MLDLIPCLFWPCLLGANSAHLDIGAAMLLTKQHPSKLLECFSELNLNLVSEQK